jgi:hypothetical protein
MITKALALGISLFAGTAHADCGARIVCDAASNGGNELDYCESENRQQISHLDGRHAGVDLDGPFSVAGDPLVAGTYGGVGYVGVHFPGWGYVGGRGPLLASAHGRSPQSLAWIEVEHEQAGQSLPLTDARVTVQLAIGCLVTRALVYERCEVRRWEPSPSDS